MKRAIAGRTARGSPPLPRQRIALRLVQLTLLLVGAALALLALGARAAGEAAVLAGGALAAVGLALGMGVRAVRGPVPPKLD